MKKIDYMLRSSFEEFESEDSEFIRRLIKDLDIQSVLEIPCANGRNLSVIGDVVSTAFFADINISMVEAVRQKILKEKKLNCKALILDMCDISKIPFDIDAIFVMQQSFQMLTAESGRKALENFCQIQCRYIVIDIYDFLCGSSDIPKFLVSTNTFADSEGRKWIRRSTISAISGCQIQLTHEYHSKEENYFAEVGLHNYSRSGFITLCEECGYEIIDYFTDYSFGKNPALGRTILVLTGRKEMKT